jgi:D-beta-D-heptose 7-phosphate kinase/D-beta-D-heptose 1-phosphate adenosyltransferase
MLEALNQIFQNRAKARIVCVGDVMLDRYVHGQAHRISPEAPIPVLNYTRAECNPGGAANVAANISAMGANVLLIGRIGQDKVSIDLRERLNSFEKVIPSWLLDETLPTTEKTRFVVGGQQLLRVDHEKNCLLLPQQVKDVLALCQPALKTAGALILSDYAKGVVTPHLCQALIQQAIKVNVPVMVDPKGADYSKYQGATLLTPNLVELRAALGQEVAGDEQVVAAAQVLMKKFHIGAVLVTRSAEGMTLVGPEHPNGFHIHSAARDVSDVSGAGDTVIAALALGMACGLTIAQSAQIANMAAGVSVASHGTVQVSLEEVKEELHRNFSAVNIAPVFSSHIDPLIEQVKQWQAQGLCVGFTNGCFDLLHAGHLHSLYEAKKQCDKLVVGLNSDTSVQQLKGLSRPLQNENTRSQVLATLRMVDAVVMFAENTPAQLIEKVLPNVLFKGSDYQNKSIAGSQAVVNAGGKVVLIDMLPGHSTTATVKKINLFS